MISCQIWVLGTKPKPLRELPVLLTTELSLQPLPWHFLCMELQLRLEHTGHVLGIMRGDIGVGWTRSEGSSVKIALELALGGWEGHDPRQEVFWG